MMDLWVEKKDEDATAEALVNALQSLESNNVANMIKKKCCPKTTFETELNFERSQSIDDPVNSKDVDMDEFQGSSKPPGPKTKSSDLTDIPQRESMARHVWRQVKKKKVAIFETKHEHTEKKLRRSEKQLRKSERKRVESEKENELLKREKEVSQKEQTRLQKMLKRINISSKTQVHIYFYKTPNSLDVYTEHN